MKISNFWIPSEITQLKIYLNFLQYILRDIPAFKAYISYSNHSGIMNVNFYLLNLVPSLIDCLASQNKPVAATYLDLIH